MKKLFTLVALLSVLSVGCTEDMIDNFKDISNQEQPTNNDDQIPHNQIWYTNGSTTMPTEPYILSTFGANIISSTYDAEKECWVITFDGNVTTIGNYAFCDCRSLTSVTIPDSVTTIGNAAFHNCDSLTSVTIPDSVTTIGEDAFAYCSSLREFNGKYASEDGRCLIIDGTLNSFAPAGLTEYIIPDSVTTIGDWAFSGCDSLTSVTIPDSVTTIGFVAFFCCYSLTSITIPDSVTTIGEGAFCDCINLTSITIPPSVTTIGSAAFRNCSGLTEFNGKFASDDKRCLIVDGTINSFAPAGITEYTIPNDVITIGVQGFACCSSIKSITIPDNVTTIGWWAFACCPNLMNVIIEDGVTTIGYGAFMECHSLTSVYCKATTPPAGEYHMFYDNASGRKIYVPIESSDAYKSASYWNEYADAIEGYNF